MADYIVGGLLLAAVVLAVRSYFGKQNAGCCNGCSGCARASMCKEAGKRKD